MTGKPSFGLYGRWVVVVAVVLAAAVMVALAVPLVRRPQAPQPSPTEAASDPAQSFRSFCERLLPAVQGRYARHGPFKLKDNGDTSLDATKTLSSESTIDVRKTQSLVSPYLGIVRVRFNNEASAPSGIWGREFLELQFAWQDQRWVLTAMTWEWRKAGGDVVRSDYLDAEGPLSREQVVWCGKRSKKSRKTLEAHRLWNAGCAASRKLAPRECDGLNQTGRGSIGELSRARSVYMSYGPIWKQKFIKRTLRLLKKYKGKNEATMLYNAMLGLLVLPKEEFLEDIPVAPEGDLPAWGIRPGSIKDFGHHRRRTTDKSKGEQGPQYTTYRENTLPGLVHSLRNAVVHFGVEPMDNGAKVTGFEFKDEATNGFHAKLTIAELLELCTKLARHVIRHGTHV